MDIIGPLPCVNQYKYILTIVDHYSKWPTAVAVKTTNSVNIVKKILKHIYKFGIPDMVLTDQGANFGSDLMKEVCESLGIKKVRTSPYHSQVDGLAERHNRTTVNMLAKSIHKDEEWPIALPSLCYVYNTRRNDTTKISSFELFFFWRATSLPIDLLFGLRDHINNNISRVRLIKMLRKVNENSKLSRDNQKKYYDKDF
ncbi:Retrovirus-related Pol polyprotein [Thelohanellus kitauei]|uniref:Retrovirus-related Pol polyprotein n=1 Tax=Thelohanellus kitauei TaxID=669202 RepID=A0A0C2MA93_THEKT|nr:Retrovirus-related Pol polyprotein [Thelohanellus kitauei]